VPANTAQDIARVLSTHTGFIEDIFLSDEFLARYAQEYILDIK
jgi:hypothetical protein